MGVCAVLQTLVLFRELPSFEWLAARRGREFRSVAQFTSGEYEGMGLISVEGAHHLTVRDLQVEISARTVGRASTYAALNLFPPLPIPIAHIPPFDYVVFAMMKVQHGFLSAYADHASSVSGDVALASSVLLGHAAHNLVIEIGGADGEEVMRVAHELCDHSSVQSVDLLHTTAELTDGFGDVSD